MTNWGGAYHWGSKSPISAEKAIEQRENGRLESGDCWCCEDCYTATPRKGIRIFPRKHKTTPHFWVGRGASNTLNECSGFSRQLGRKESFRYTQFYRDLQTWLNSEAAREQLDFSGYHEVQGNKYSDFILDIQNEISGFLRLEFLIVHKNSKRSPETDCSIVIDISQWTESELAKFEDFGVRKISDEYSQLIARLGDQQELIDNGAMESRREKIEKSLQNFFDELPIPSKFRISERMFPRNFEKISEGKKSLYLEVVESDSKSIIEQAIDVTVKTGEYYQDQIKQFETYLGKLKSLGSQDFAHYEDFDQIRNAWFGIKESNITFLQVIHHRYRVNDYHRYKIDRNYNCPAYEHVERTSNVGIFLPEYPKNLVESSVNILKSKQLALLKEYYRINRYGQQLSEDFIEMLPLHDAFCEQVSKLWSQTGMVDNKFSEFRELLNRYITQADHFLNFDDLRDQYIAEVKKAIAEGRSVKHRRRDPATGVEYPDSIGPMPKIEFIAMDYEL